MAKRSDNLPLQIAECLGFRRNGGLKTLQLPFRFRVDDTARCREAFEIDER